MVRFDWEVRTQFATTKPATGASSFHQSRHGRRTMPMTTSAGQTAIPVP